jgi:hypothetical protein
MKKWKKLNTIILWVGNKIIKNYYILVKMKWNDRKKNTFNFLFDLSDW